MKHDGNDFFELLKKRRSIRKWTGERIPEAELVAIAGAAGYAPSAGNGNPVRVLSIRNKAAMQKMLDASVDAMFKDGDNPEDSKAGFIEWSRQYTKADAFIIILEDRESRHPTYESHDCPIAAGFILLAAEALGYGATYLTDTLNPEGCKAALGIPARYSPFCAIAVGVPEERPTAPKKPSIEEVVWNESIGVPFQSIN